MQVCNLFFKLLRRNMKTAVIFTAVFLVIAFAISGSSDKSEMFKENRLSVAVIDNDSSEASKALTDFIGSKHELRDAGSDMAEITENLYWESVNYVLIINEGFEQRLTAGETEDLFGEYRVHDDFSTVYMKTVLNEYVKTAQACLAAGSSLTEALQQTSEAVGMNTEVTYSKESSEGSEEFSSSFAVYFQYMPYILISVMLSALGVVLSSLNKKGVRYRTECSAVSPRSVTLQIFAGAAVFVIAVWLIYNIAGMIMYGGIFRGKAWLAALNSLIFTLVSASIAIFVSSFDLEDNVFSVITQILGLGISFLCGVFVPLSVMNSGVISAARFLPAYWYIRANDMLIGREAFSAGSFTGFLLIETGFAVVLLMLTFVVKRSRAHETAA
ncbi:MAG: ABC transporter permease [Ruminococcus sp.]|nr:ABC transporter permease [Ruminococcus sp.]